MSKISSPSSKAPDASRSKLLDGMFQVLGFLILVALAFRLPAFPALELDSSWRQALGRFYFDGLQFGTDVVFTYGPLGFAMGNTFWGDHWSVLIGWQLAEALVFAGVVYWHARHLAGYSRIFFLGFFFLFGLSYVDAAHQSIITLAGLALVRGQNQPWRWGSLFWLLLLAVLSLVKFTNLLLAFFLVLLAGLHELRRPWRWQSLRVPLLFVALVLVGWRLCGQQLGHLPAYAWGSWEISQGYQDTMGFASNSWQLRNAIIVAALILAYLALNLLTAPDRRKTLLLTTGVLGYLYLNWKHGFIRADGHQVGWYYAVLTVAVTSPLLLGDGIRWLRRKQVVLFATGLLCLTSMESVLPSLVRGILAASQDKVDRHVSFALGNAFTRDLYDSKLAAAQNIAALPKIKAVVGDRPVDVLGFEQAVALFNGFNYTPRPVFQSYSAYTPYLARLNARFFAGDRAPDFVLLKLQTLDHRLPTMDDSLALRLLVERYRFILSERGFTLWQRRPEPYDAAAFAPTPVRTDTHRFGETISLSDLAERDLWVQIDYRFSLLGKLRRFFLRPAEVYLHATDTRGVTTAYRLPAPIGRTGFMLNPLVDNLLEFMRAHGGNPSRRIASIRLDTSPHDRDCVRAEFQLRLSTLPPSDAGKAYLSDSVGAHFPHFAQSPISFTAHLPPSEGEIDGHAVTVMHAPSEMVFDVPLGATMVRGDFGFIAGAYSNGGRTNGSRFTVYWTDGSDRKILHERYLNPATQLNDRGLQSFSAPLPSGLGQVVMTIDPGAHGAYAFDWTAWSGLEFQ
ncbi:MAG: hypothetical protein IT582_06465 [Opitutaceae bacterium]|nr:hypothetical protein [Opitutaceae bacterium]